MEKLPLLDIVIGLSLIYTCLSLLASELTEFVITVLHWRAKCLKQSIITLLGESSLRDDPERLKDTIAGKLLNSSGIVSMVQSFDRRNGSKILTKVIPRLFAEGLLDVLQGLPSPELPLSNFPETNYPAAEKIDAEKANSEQTIAEKANSEQTIAYLLSIVKSSPELSPQLRKNLQRIFDRVQRVEPDTHRQRLQLIDEIGRWFSYAIIDGLTTYKHRFKTISFLVSLGLVIAMNVDSLYIIRRISENTATRTMIIQNSTQIQDCKNHLDSPNCVKRLSFLMESTTIPVGWQPSNRKRQFSQLNKVIILRTIGGWFLTSIAVAMGSRFWLRLLNQFAIVLRGKGKPRRSHSSIA